MNNPFDSKETLEAYIENMVKECNFEFSNECRDIPYSPLTINTGHGVKVVRKEVDLVGTPIKCVYLMGTSFTFHVGIFIIESGEQLSVVLDDLVNNIFNRIALVVSDNIEIKSFTVVPLNSKTRIVELFGNKDELNKLKFTSWWPNLVKVDINNELVAGMVNTYTDDDLFETISGPVARK